MGASGIFQRLFGEVTVDQQKSERILRAVQSCAYPPSPAELQDALGDVNEQDIDELEAEGSIEIRTRPSDGKRQIHLPKKGEN